VNNWGILEDYFPSALVVDWVREMKWRHAVVKLS